MSTMTSTPAAAVATRHRAVSPAVAALFATMAALLLAAILTVVLAPQRSDMPPGRQPAPAPAPAVTHPSKDVGGSTTTGQPDEAARAARSQRKTTRRLRGQAHRLDDVAARTARSAAPAP